MATQTTATLPRAAQLAPKADCPEIDARDRESVIFCYLETLLRNAREDIQTATGALARGSTEYRAADDAMNQIDMAEDYLSEMRRLASRPID